MRFYCLSDLHLHDTQRRFLFSKEKEGTFARVAKEALATGATMIFAGDVFDLTGMQPPQTGLRSFFEGAVPGVTPTCPPRRSLGARMRDVAQVYPDFVAALAPLAEQGRAIFLPGNHDHGLDSDEGRAALAAAMSVAPDRLRFEETLRVGGFVFGAHGHEFDPLNTTDEGPDNPGAVIMSALYHALMPALVALGVESDVAEAVPCVRPEENIITGLEARLDADTMHRVLLAFVKLLLENGYLVGPLAHVKVLLATELLTSLLTPEKVRQALADDNALKESARAAAERILRGEHHGLPPDAVVMGHTHELDWTDAYVNLGTWIDHVRGLDAASLAQPDRTLPVLVLDEASRWARLHDVQSFAPHAGVERVADCPVLWRFGLCTDV